MCELLKQLKFTLLCVLVIQFALVNKLHQYIMCYSKLLNVNNDSSLTDQISVDGINDHCDYIEPKFYKRAAHPKHRHWCLTTECKRSIK